MDNEIGLRILAELADIKAQLAGKAVAPNRSLSRKEAAVYLGLHEKTLADLTTTGAERDKVTGYKTGARWKYRLADLDRYRNLQAAIVRRGSGSGREIDWGQ